MGGRDPDVGYEDVLSEAPLRVTTKMLRPLRMSA